MSSPNGSVIINSRPPSTTTIKCPQCSSVLEFEIPGKFPSGVGISIKCHNLSCLRLIPFDPLKNGTTIPPSFNTNLNASSFASGTSASSSTSTPKKERFKIGTDKDPLSKEYYEILGVSPDSTNDEIKKKYRVLAMKYHPDKQANQEDLAEAEEKFKKISEAYQVLSDPVLRQQYNEFGPGQADPKEGFMNPEEFFKKQFGGDLFDDIIGPLSLAKDFKNVMFRNEEEEEEEGEGGEKTVEKTKEDEDEKFKKSLEKRKEEMEIRKKDREERVAILAEKLKSKLSIFTDNYGNPTNERHFRDVLSQEAEDLKVQNFGTNLLASVGYIYYVKAAEYLSREEFLGIGISFLHKMRLKGRSINNTFSTVKHVVDVHKTFVQLQEAEKAGSSQEEKDKLEEEAAKKGIDALWRGCKMEVEGVIRSVCDKVLSPDENKSFPTGPTQADKILSVRRAEGLKIIGEIYQRAAGEPV